MTETPKGKSARALWRGSRPHELEVASGRRGNPPGRGPCSVSYRIAVKPPSPGGGSNAQYEQSNRTESDNQHCERYRIVVQPIQLLLHGVASPVLPNPGKRAAETTLSGSSVFRQGALTLRRRAAGPAVSETCLEPFS
jgi:hypothetical protein